MPKNYLLLTLVLGGAALTSCKKDNELAVSYPAYAEASNPKVLATAPNGTFRTPPTRPAASSKTASLWSS